MLYSAFGALQMHSSAVDHIRGFFFKMFWAVFCYWEVLSGMALDVFCNNGNLIAVGLTCWNAEMAGQQSVLPFQCLKDAWRRER